ncbi:hypothetical protein C5167_018489 [Papaver somniferum]|uniref:Uncharacterized protein n=1 Tax=Papaver somniferum TaxID=3469 RepID=A0A4Y7IRK4_PAPSO|nr:hypothetical protein C5167_018489 [Papaver somniferum]
MCLPREKPKNKSQSLQVSSEPAQLKSTIRLMGVDAMPDTNIINWKFGIQPVLLVLIAWVLSGHKISPFLVTNFTVK